MRLPNRSAAACTALIAALAFAAAAAAAERRPSYSFQAVLLLADNQTPGSLEGVPPNAQAAMRDAASFLPYKSYRLLDLAWVRTSFRGASRVAGPDGATYLMQVVVDPNESDGTKLVVAEFRLIELLPNGVEKPTPLLRTTFSMAPGETVVVGTSRLDGPNKALVVLLTAIP
jgi:hypothetical protein